MAKTYSNRTDYKAKPPFPRYANCKRNLEYSARHTAPNAIYRESLVWQFGFFGRAAERVQRNDSTVKITPDAFSEALHVVVRIIWLQCTTAQTQYEGDVDDGMTYAGIERK